MREQKFSYLDRNETQVDPSKRQQKLAWNCFFERLHSKHKNFLSGRFLLALVVKILFDS